MIKIVSRRILLWATEKGNSLEEMNDRTIDSLICYKIWKELWNIFYFVSAAVALEFLCSSSQLSISSICGMNFRRNHHTNLFSESLVYKQQAAVEIRKLDPVLGSWKFIAKMHTTDRRDQKTAFRGKWIVSDEPMKMKFI